MRSNTLHSEFVFDCMEDSNDAVMLTELDGTIFYVNPAWETFFGYKKNEAIGQTPRILRSGFHQENFYTEMWSHILNPEKGHWRGEVINRTKDGREVFVLLSISSRKNKAGRLLGYMSIAVDNSEKKKLETQLQWQDRLATVGVLASGLAHELGTPLGVARGRAEYLLNQSTDKSVEQTSLVAIISQIDRVSNLMQSLQNLVRPSSSEGRVSLSLVDAVESVVSLLNGKFNELSIKLKLGLESKAKVMAEPGLLEYIIMNIIMNSIQAIEGNKKNKMKVDNVIEIISLEEKNFWKFSVRDTGGGVPPEHTQHLFKPFFTTKEVGVGTGLGLSMIYQIIRSWNGTIEFENQLGVGATFHIRFPK